MGSNNNVFLLEKRSNSGTAGCHNCIRKQNCPGYELSVAGSSSMRQIVHQKPTQQGQHIYNLGEECEGIYVVRSGGFKSYCLDEDGDLQVLGFHLPGELFGVEGLINGTHEHAVEALCTSSVCKIPLACFSYAVLGDGRQSHIPLLRMLGRVISRDHKMIFVLSKMNAQRRFAFFLLDLIARLRHAGFEQSEFMLAMSRADMANYLGLAVETVSRLFTRMQSRGLLAVDRRHLKIFDPQALRDIVDRDNGQPDDDLLLDKAG